MTKAHLSRFIPNAHSTLPKNTMVDSHKVNLPRIAVYKDGLKYSEYLYFEMK